MLLAATVAGAVTAFARHPSFAGALRLLIEAVALVVVAGGAWQARPQRED